MDRLAYLHRGAAWRGLLGDGQIVGSDVQRCQGAAVVSTSVDCDAAVFDCYGGCLSMPVNDPKTVSPRDLVELWVPPKQCFRFL